MILYKNKIFHTTGLILSFLLLQGCTEEPDLDKNTHLLNTIKNMETAIEAKALDDFMDHISEDFTLTSRGYKKKDAERILRIRMMRNKNIHVHQAIKSIEWLNEGEEQATVEIVAAVAGSDFSLTDLPTLRGDMAKFKVTFQLVDGEYMITQTTWDRATPADFVL